MTEPLGPNDHLPNREAFGEFLTRLRADYATNGHTWENATLDDFLEALTAWTTNADDWYTNFGHQPPESGDWTFFARALTAARIYE